MSAPENLVSAKALIDAIIEDPDASVEETGAALASVITYVVDQWKLAHRVRNGEATTEEPQAEG